MQPLALQEETTRKGLPASAVRTFRSLCSPQAPAAVMIPGLWSHGWTCHRSVSRSHPIFYSLPWLTRHPDSSSLRNAPRPLLACSLAVQTSCCRGLRAELHLDRLRRPLRPEIKIAAPSCQRLSSLTGARVRCAAFFYHLPMLQDGRAAQPAPHAPIILH